jgi:hypothetical protein
LISRSFWLLPSFNCMYLTHASKVLF